jgi:hypothetical protein
MVSMLLIRCLSEWCFTLRLFSGAGLERVLWGNNLVDTRSCQQSIGDNLHSTINCIFHTINYLQVIIKKHELIFSSNFSRQNKR